MLPAPQQSGWGGYHERHTQGEEDRPTIEALVTVSAQGELFPGMGGRIRGGRRSDYSAKRRWREMNREKARQASRRWRDANRAADVAGSLRRIRRRRADDPVYDRTRRYGITTAEAEAAVQTTHCPLCGRLLTPRTRDFDHDHESGRFRGAVCARCNRLIIPSIEAIASGEISMAAILEHLDLTASQLFRPSDVAAKPMTDSQSGRPGGAQNQRAIRKGVA